MPEEPPSSASKIPPGFGRLTPSQAMAGDTGRNTNSSSSNSNGNVPPPPSYRTLAPSNLQGPPESVGNNKNQKRNQNRNRKRNNKPKGNNNSANGESENQEQQPSGENNNPKGRRRPRGRKGGKNSQAAAGNQDEQQVKDSPQDTVSQASKPPGTNASGQKKKRNRKPKKRCPWRQFIPAGAVDPITLEELNTLPYPPFALCIDEPHEPVPIWPIPETKGTEGEGKIDVEELNRRRLEEQWGHKLKGPGGDSEEQKLPSVPPQQRHYNLYDGRALAYYMVSELQFIDPMNRRDLTRPELLNLDDYLIRHGFDDLRVTDAYDAKGVTLSSAGATAATAQGRAQIMQEMAKNLLASLFGGNSVASNKRTPYQQQNSLRDQYNALQRQEQQEEARRREQRQSQSQGTSLNPNATPFGDAGVFVSEDGGLMVIDDDEFPGLRGGDYRQAYTIAREIQESQQVEAFPALPTPPTTAPAPAPPPPQHAPAVTKSGKASKTLSRIAGAVKKTNPEEQQRQWEAREEARKRALMSNLSFGVDASILNTTTGGGPQLPMKPEPTLASLPVTEGQLERNRAFSEALGVRPATMRQNLNSGWARPTDQKVALDEFGNELSASVYPEALIAEARERMPLLLKVERKWKSFLADDKAASVPLNAMDRPSRKFVHHYSDFWNLKTESFDPEPQRYIHCVKMLHTHMPRPLLSDAARNWRGPLAPPSSFTKCDHTTQQTAGQTTRSREVTPIPFARMSLPTGPAIVPAMKSGDEDSGDQVAFRFGSLVEGERPKLELAKRTKPLELAPFEPETDFAAAFEAERRERQAKMMERKQKQQEVATQKRLALQDAFASDDEEEERGKDSDSDWDEPKPLYTGSDDED